MFKNIWSVSWSKKTSEKIFKNFSQKFSSRLPSLFSSIFVEFFYTIVLLMTYSNKLDCVRGFLKKSRLGWVSPLLISPGISLFFLFLFYFFISWHLFICYYFSYFMVRCRWSSLRGSPFVLIGFRCLLWWEPTISTKGPRGRPTDMDWTIHYDWDTDHSLQK